MLFFSPFLSLLILLLFLLLFRFDGYNHRHWTTSFEGDRYSVVFYRVHDSPTQPEVPELPFHIAVPSHHRPGKLIKETLTTLSKHGLLEYVTVFVALDEYETYDEALKAAELDVRLAIGCPGLCEQRVFISGFFKPGTRLVFIDDDVTKIQRLTNPTRARLPIDDLSAVIEESFAYAASKNVCLWGVFTSEQKPPSEQWSGGLRYICGALFGVLAGHPLFGHRCSYDSVCEDYLNSILAYELDGGVLRRNDIIVTTDFNVVDGGVATDDVDASTLRLPHEQCERELRSLRAWKHNTIARKLLEQYPGYISHLVDRKKDPRQAIMFKRGLKTSPRVLIHQFWHNKDESTTLPPYVAVSLGTWERFSEHKVYLWTYLDLEGVPDGVVVCDATKLMPKPVFNDWLQKGVLIEHISDLIRLEALAKFGGWWADSDTLCLRPITSYPRGDEHVFMSYLSPANGGRAIREHAVVESLAKRPRPPPSNDHYDGWEYIGNAILHFPEGSVLLPKYIEAVRANLELIAQKPAAFARGTGSRKKNPKDYNINMNTLVRLIEDHGLLDCVPPPRAFCSNNAFKSSKEMRDSWEKGAEKLGHKIPTLAELLADPRAFTVHLHAADKSYDQETLDWVWTQITGEVKKKRKKRNEVS